MQTFLPYADFWRSAEVLDYRRLGKQRVEVKQIVNTLLDNSSGVSWKNHPTVLMWKGHEHSLLQYGIVICMAWRLRGYRDSLEPELQDRLAKIPETPPPSWLGYEAFHSSHRAALLFKNYDWYSQFNWTEIPGLNYIWPTKIDQNMFRVNANES